MDRKSGAGFTKVVSVVEGLESFAGHQVRIQAKNENYVAERVCPNNTEILACTPDLISIVDSNTGTCTCACTYMHVHACMLSSRCSSDH